MDKKIVFSNWDESFVLFLRQHCLRNFARMFNQTLNESIPKVQFLACGIALRPSFANKEEFHIATLANYCTTKFWVSQ